MPNIIKPKRSTVAAKVPTTSDIVNGEIAINSTDKKIYTNAGGTVTQVGAGALIALSDVVVTSPTTGQTLSYNGTNWVNATGAGTGDVVGAASSTDNAITRFDGTTGKVIQNSTVTLDDTGNLANVNAIGFDTTPGTLPTAAGSMYWDTGNGSPSIVLDADVTLQLGQEQIALVYNGTGSTITNGSVVAVTGAQGQRPSVVLADADSESLSANTLGIATEDIANGAEGFITTFGFVRGLNTSAFTAGAPIYLSQTAGQFTATRPSAPAHTVILGWIIKVNASSGEVFVNINNGWELDELHNVLITSPTSGNTLIYDAAAGVWKNANITAGTGISITNGAGSISIANTGVTSVAMTVPTGLSVSGTPITTTGTLAITLTAGYSIPTTSSQTNWDTAFADRLKWDGGSTGLVAATGRTSLGATTVGGNMFTLTNPSAITFPRFNADNTVSALDAATFRTAIGAGTGSGTVTSVTGTSPVASSGGATPAISLASGYGDTQNPYASKTANNFLAAPNGTTGAPTFRAIVAADIPTLNQNTTGTASNVSGTVAIANGGTGATTAANALTNLGAYPASNPSGYTSNTGTVTSIAAGTGLSGGTITTTGTIALANTAVTAGSYTNTNITVDAQGRITAASNGSAGGVTSFNTRTGAVTLTSGDVTTALGFTPYNATNPSSFIALSSAITGYTVGANTALAATDTLLAALGKLQGQVTARGTGTVTSVGGTGTVNGISLSGTVTSSGNLTLGGTLSGVSLTTQVSGTLPIANGGTGETTRQAAMDALAGAVTSGQYLRGNGADVVMSTIQAADVPTLNQSTTGSAATLTTGRTIAITGDLTYTSGSFNGSANVTGTGTLANSGVTAGSYTTANITVDAKGRVTAASSGTVAGVLAGTVIYYAANTAPTGYLKANGALVSRSTYSALFSAIGTTFGAGDGSTTFALPDLRGYFVRSWADNGSIDSGRGFGSTQTDAFQGHYHLVKEASGTQVIGSTLNAGGGGFGTVEAPNAHAGINRGDTQAMDITTGVNGTPRTASETRPTNLALLACIKF